MYSKKDIIKTLNEYNYYIEEQVLASFIKNWKIDAIYEDEDGVEFFDNLSIIKLKKGISLKSKGYSNDEIMYHINKVVADNPALQEPKTSEKITQEVQPTEIVSHIETAVESVAQSGDLKNVTVDITSQTLQMLADVVAGKITDEIKQQIKGLDFTPQVALENPLKEQNKELLVQVEELLDDNKKLAARIQLLEGRKFHPLTWFEGFINSFKR